MSGDDEIHRDTPSGPSVGRTLVMCLCFSTAAFAVWMLGQLIVA